MIADSEGLSYPWLPFCESDVGAVPRTMNAQYVKVILLRERIVFLYTVCCRGMR